MDRQQLPFTAFIDPSGENEREVEALVHQVLKRLLDHLSHSDSSPLTSSIELEDLVNLPETSIDESLLLERLEKILAGSMNPYSPMYIGHMDSMPTVMSVLGDLVASAINNNMLSVEMSPILSRLEPLLLEQFATLFGLGKLFRDFTKLKTAFQIQAPYMKNLDNEINIGEVSVQGTRHGDISSYGCRCNIWDIVATLD